MKTNGNIKPLSKHNRRRVEELLSGVHKSYSTAAEEWGVHRSLPGKIVKKYCRRHFMVHEWTHPGGIEFNLKGLQVLFGRTYGHVKFKILQEMEEL